MLSNEELPRGPLLLPLPPPLGVGIDRHCCRILWSKAKLGHKETKFEEREDGAREDGDGVRGGERERESERAGVLS